MAVQPIEGVGGILSGCSEVQFQYRHKYAYSGIDVRISSARKTFAPPGWRFLNFDTS